MIWFSTWGSGALGRQSLERIQPADAPLRPASQALKEATAEIHAQLDRSPVWETVFASIEEYVKFLAALRKLIFAAEQAVDAQVTLPPHLLATRRTSSWIDADLKDLATPVISSQISAEPQSADPPELDFSWLTRPAQAYGVWYVLEGSSMGSVILTRMAQQRLHLSPPKGTRYLAAYGAQTGIRWKQTRTWIDEGLTTSSEIAGACDAAIRTFSAYGWVLSRPTEEKTQ